MKKLLLSLLFLYQHAAAQDTLFRFALVSDTHVGTQSGAEDLERTITDINQQPQIEFVIFSGDITEFGSDEELKLSKSIISKLNKPWHIIPGNHDTKWSESGCNTFRTVYGDETFSFEHKGYWFIGTNCGPNMRMGPGQVPRENIVWLDAQLKKQNRSKPIIYINHYPQDDGLNNWYDVLNRLRDRNVKLMLCGHGHSNHAYNWEGVPGIMCRSNLRAKAEIGGYNIISVTDKEFVFNERTPGVTTLKAWNITPIAAKPAWVANPPRPSYNMNAEFPQVKVKWEVQESGDMGSGVAITADKVIYTNTNGEVKAVNLQTGKKIWQYKTNGKIYATPLVHQQYVIVPSTDGSVYCLQTATGKLQWKQATGKAIVSSPALFHNLAIIAGSDGHCRAYDIPSGKPQWDFDSVKGFVEAKPFVYEGNVLFGSWGNHFYSLDAATGKPRWDWTNGAANRMFSPAAVWPVAVDQKAYIVSPDQYMTAINTQTGETLWRARDTGNRVRESMGISVDSNRIYAKTMQGFVLAFNARSQAQELVWKSPVAMGYEICPSPLNEMNGVLYVPTGSGVLYALSAKDGSLLWKHKFSNCLINTAQPVNNNTVITSSMDGKLLCLEVK